MATSLLNSVPPNLARALESPWASIRRDAVVEIGSRTSPAGSFDLLLRGLDDPDADVRFAAAFELGQTELQEAIGPLAERLEDPDEKVRLAAVRALKRLGAIEVVRDPRPTRLSVYYGLGLFLLASGILLASAVSAEIAGVLVGVAGIVLLAGAGFGFLRTAADQHLMVYGSGALGDPTLLIASISCTDMGFGDLGGLFGGDGGC